MSIEPLKRASSQGGIVLYNQRRRANSLCRLALQSRFANNRAAVKPGAEATEPAGAAS